MKPFLLKFILPLILAGALFGYLTVYRDGWDVVTYSGGDTWSLFFSSLGSVSAPLIVGLVVAGLVKLFKRGANFLDVWLTVFLIAVALFAYSVFTVARYEKEETALNFLQTGIGECPITADFVAEPQFSTQSMGTGEVVTARASVREGVVAIECTGLPADQVFSEMTDAEILRQYLSFWGIEPLEGAEATVSKFKEPVPHFGISGQKEISGSIARYHFRFFRFEQSFAMASVATRLSRPEPPDVRRFLDSLAVEY